MRPFIGCPVPHSLFPAFHIWRWPPSVPQRRSWHPACLIAANTPLCASPNSGLLQAAFDGDDCRGTKHDWGTRDWQFWLRKPQFRLLLGDVRACRWLQPHDPINRRVRPAKNSDRGRYAAIWRLPKKAVNTPSISCINSMVARSTSGVEQMRID